jgi:hypothetical protein
MRLQAAVMALLSLTAVPSAPTEETAAMIGSNPMLTYHDVRKVAPALEAYTQNRVLGRFGNAPALGRVVASSHWQPLIAYERLRDPSAIRAFQGIQNNN